MGKAILRFKKYLLKTKIILLTSYTFRYTKTALSKRINMLPGALSSHRCKSMRPVWK